MVIKHMVIKKIIKIILIIAAVVLLSNTDSYYPVYIFVGIMGVLGVCKKVNVVLSKNQKNISIGFGIWISCMILMANWDMIAQLTGMIFRIILIAGTAIMSCEIILLVASICVQPGKAVNFRGGVECDTELTGIEKPKYHKNDTNKKYVYILFVVSFAVMSVIRFIVVWNCKYPCIFNDDTISQIRQALSGVYSNHHPFYHTQFIRVCLILSQTIGKSMEFGMFMNSFIQLCIMSAVFSLATITLYQIAGEKKIAVIAFLIYGLFPIHITYSFTMWKDPLFGTFMLLYCVAFFRCLNCIGPSLFNRILLCVSVIGVCLFRSNGFFCFVLTLISFILLYRCDIFSRDKSNAANDKILAKRNVVVVLTIMLLSGVAGYILKHPVLDYLNVTRPDKAEMLSIPIQQVGEVMMTVDESDLSPDDRALLDYLGGYDKIRENYQRGFSDPLKNMIRESGNVEFFESNLRLYAGLYINQLVSHPVEMIKAWVYQTCGYYNGAYKQFIDWNRVGKPNEWDIVVKSYNDTLYDVWGMYGRLWESFPPLRIIMGIGFNGWLVIILMMAGIIMRDKGTILMSLHPFWLVISLLVSTPANTMYRYAYGVFCCVPFIMLQIFADRE